MATYPNGVVSPDPGARIPANGSGAWDIVAASADAQLGARSRVGHTHAWGEVTGKPIVFPPGPHRHGWADLDGAPATFPPTAHEHPVSDVEGLRSELDGKVGDADPRLSDARAPLAHVHELGDVDGLEDALALAGERVSVRAYGAVGDGASDDTAAFTTALASGAPVYVPGGTYLVSGAVVDGPMHLSLADDAVLQHDATGPAILISGTETPNQTESGITLNKDVQAGDTSFIALGHDLIEGDYFRIGSELAWDASSTNIRQGEILRVASADGSGFTSTTPVMGGPYLQADSAAIWRLDLVNGVTIRGGTIRGPRTSNHVQTGVQIRRARNVTIEDVRFENIDYRHISVEDSLDVHISRTAHDWAQDAGMAYGIAVTGACQNVTISRGTFVDCRHAVTTSNYMGVRGVTRFLTVSDCVVRRTLPALNENGSGGDAFDTHTAADYVTFDRNIVEGSSGGGINVECRHSKVRWNTILAPTGAGIHVHNESDHDGSTEIIGNHVVAGPATTYGIRVSPASRGSGATLRGVVVAHNTVKGVQSTPIYMGHAAYASLYAVSAVGNVYVACPGAYMIRLVNGYGVNVGGNTSDRGQAKDIITDHAPKGDDAGFEYGTFAGEAISITPTGRYIQLTGSTSDQSLRTINGAARGQFITLIAPLNGNRITISTAGHIYLPAPLSIAGRETVTLAWNGFTWSEVSRSVRTVIAYDTDGVPYLEGA